MISEGLHLVAVYELWPNLNPELDPCMQRFTSQFLCHKTASGSIHSMPVVTNLRELPQMAAFREDHCWTQKGMSDEGTDVPALILVLLDTLQ